MKNFCINRQNDIYLNKTKNSLFEFLLKENFVLLHVKGKMFKELLLRHAKYAVSFVSIL